MVQTRSQKITEQSAVKSQPSTTKNETEPSSCTNGNVPSSYEAAPDADEELLHVVEHHRGHSSAFSTKEDDIHKDAEKI